MIVSELLIGFVVVLLCAYWFRYNCQAILKTRISRDRARQVAEANELRFIHVAEALDGEVTREDLDRFNFELQRDYSVLTCLLRYSSQLPVPGFTVDERLLMADFRLLHFWYAMVRHIAFRRAKRAMLERVRILVHFGNRMAERSSALIRV